MPKDPKIQKEIERINNAYDLILGMIGGELYQRGLDFEIREYLLGVPMLVVFNEEGTVIDRKFEYEFDEYYNELESTTN
ncbi:hypothetical protein TCA2_4480 [Paenibacillus sp. TCA20]|uniref:Uncharacterized protein n=1 Tax=Paenibacillus urinalis TaxID=521520 RepID=A0ABY7XJZ6_9BACL|nr:MULTISPECIES: hypothetical protein [Paenibacillus]WDI05185.1 hypothetical protein PUW25_25590 [Paenibacillus urinalis]GAK41988.1 hypothetical protein TCA2_4480 [Paenibacillus sp. TCA20]